MRGRWTAGVVVVAIAGIAWACSSDVAITIGDAMVDTGTALRDGSSADASAQPMVDVPCNIERTYVQRYEMGEEWRETRLTYWYAEARFDEAVRGRPIEVGGVLCGHENFTTTASACDVPGWSCTGEQAFPELDCTAAHVSFAGGVARTNCGYRSSTSSNSMPTPSITGFRRTTARLYVR